MQNKEKDSVYKLPNVIGDGHQQIRFHQKQTEDSELAANDKQPLTDGTSDLEVSRMVKDRAEHVGKQMTEEDRGAVVANLRAAADILENGKQATSDLKVVDQ